MPRRHWASRRVRVTACPQAHRCRRSTCRAHSARAAPAARCRMRVCASPTTARSWSAAACSTATWATPCRWANGGPAATWAASTPTAPAGVGPQEEPVITAYGRNVSRMGGDRAAQPPGAAAGGGYGDGAGAVGGAVVARADADDARPQPAVDAANATLPDYARIARWTRGRSTRTGSHRQRPAAPGHPATPCRRTRPHLESTV